MRWDKLCIKKDRTAVGWPIGQKWKTSWSCLEGLLKLPGRPIEAAWKAYWSCLVGLLELHGRSIGAVW